MLEFMPRAENKRCLYRKENRFDGGARAVLFVRVSTAVSPFNFGYPYTRTTFNSYLMQDRTGSYDFFHPYIWNHLCFSWGQGKPSTLMLVNDMLDLASSEHLKLSISKMHHRMENS